MSANKMRYYKPTHFKIQELVPPEVYQERGEQSLALLDPRILYTLDGIREHLGIPLNVNTWFWNGGIKYRGFRPADCPVGAKYSQHKFGRAIDFVSSQMSAHKMRQEILAAKSIFPFIVFMEDNVGWVHIDVRNDPVTGIYLFNP